MSRLPAPRSVAAYDCGRGGKVERGRVGRPASVAFFLGGLPAFVGSPRLKILS